VQIVAWFDTKEEARSFELAEIARLLPPGNCETYGSAAYIKSLITN